MVVLLHPVLLFDEGHDEVKLKPLEVLLHPVLHILHHCERLKMLKIKLVLVQRKVQINPTVAPPVRLPLPLAQARIVATPATLPAELALAF